MKIVFVMSGISLGGGTRVVFKHSEMLRDKGHAVSIIFPHVPTIKGLNILQFTGIKYYIKQLIMNTLINKTVNVFGTDVVVTKIPFMHKIFMPDADVVVATQWSTAYFVDKLAPAKGKKIYFIQGYETFTGPDGLVEATYSLPLRKIVVAKWLRDLIKNKYNQDSTVVMNGVDQKIFYNDGSFKKDSKRKRVLMVYHSNPIKGIEGGIQAFLQVKQRINDADLIMFGAWKGKDVPDWVEYHVNPSQEKIRELYCTSHVYVCPSKMEGFALPPMEAMSCKLPTVLTNVGAISNYSIPGITTLLSEPGEVSALAENILKILENEEIADSIGEAGYRYIKQFTWEKSNCELEKVFNVL